MGASVTNVLLDSLEQGLVNGILASRSPSVSWLIASDQPNWIQQSYSIKIRYNDDSTETYGPVTSSNSTNVSWPGRKLKSKDFIAVSVQVTDRFTITPDWSEWFYFETGFLDNEWTSPFVAQLDQIKSTGRVAPETLLRSPEFKTGGHKKVARARLYATALGVYDLEINGQRVSQNFLAPGWTSYSHRLLHQVYDVTGLLNENSNVVGARVASGWYSGFLGFDGGATNIYGHHRAVSMLLELTFVDGSREVVMETNDQWTAKEGPVVNGQLYIGEEYDANKEVEGWSNVSTDISGWDSVEVIGRPSLILPQNFGYTVAVDTLTPQEIITTPSGATIVDFGQNAVGVLHVKRLNAAKGHKITIKHAEVLEHGELGTRPLRQATATDVYTFKGDPEGEEYIPRFTFHGFRYAELLDWPETVTKDSVSLLVLSTKMDYIGQFESSNQSLNRLHQNVFHSARGNFLSIPMDCPQRDERMGWLGDIAVFAPTALRLFDCDKFLASWLHDLRLEQIQNGGYPSVVVPDVIFSYETLWNGVYAAIWQDASVIVPYRIWEATGNVKILRAQYESMKTWWHFIPKVEGKIRWVHMPLQLGDWLDPSTPPENPFKGQTDATLVADAFLQLITVQLARIAQLLAIEEDVAYFQKAAQQSKQDFQDEYVTANGRLTSESQTAYTLALAFDLLADDTQKEKAGERLRKLCEASEFNVGTGFAGTPFLLSALTKSGNTDTAYKMLLKDTCPSWLYAVKMGATTTWERWDSMLPSGEINPGDMTSFNHYSLGAVANWMHEAIGGVVALEAGYKKFQIAPQPGGSLEWAEVTHRSPYGWIKSRWEIVDRVLKLSVSVPCNTTAVVELPGMEKAEVGSGEWNFEVEWEE